MSISIQQEEIVYIRGIKAEWIEERLEETENAFGEKDIKYKSYRNKIKYGDKLFSPEEFFKFLYPKDYKKYPYKVKFKGQLAKDIERLSSNQRTKLMYDILAYKYPDMINVNTVEEEQIIKLFSYSDKENIYAQNIYYKLQYKDGIRKIITFGCGLKIDCAAHGSVWCYDILYKENKRIYRGIKLGWEEWKSLAIQPIIDNNRLNRNFPVEHLELYKRYLYYNDCYYTSLTISEKKILEDWIYKIVSKKELIEIPLKGDTGSDNYIFEVNYNDDKQIEIVENIDLKKNMSQYNIDNNIKKGIERMKKHYELILKKERYTTKELEELGIDKNARTRLKKNGLLLSGGRGVYLNNLK